MKRDPEILVLLSNEAVEYHFVHDQNLTLSFRFNNSIQTATEAKIPSKIEPDWYVLLWADADTDTDIRE